MKTRPTVVCVPDPIEQSAIDALRDLGMIVHLTCSGCGVPLYVPSVGLVTALAGESSVDFTCSTCTGLRVAREPDTTVRRPSRTRRRAA